MKKLEWSPWFTMEKISKYVSNREPAVVLVRVGRISKRYAGELEIGKAMELFSSMSAGREIKRIRDGLLGRSYSKTATKLEDQLGPYAHWAHKPYNVYFSVATVAGAIKQGLVPPKDTALEPKQDLANKLRAIYGMAESEYRIEKTKIIVRKRKERSNDRTTG